MLTTIFSILIAAVCLKVVAAVLPNLEIENWTSAIGLAVVMGFGGSAIAFVLAPSLAPVFGAGGWIAFAIGFVVNVIALAVAAAVVPGVRTGGIATVILAAGLLAAMQGVSVSQ